jgi:hypothetical protein
MAKTEDLSSEWNQWLNLFDGHKEIDRIVQLTDEWYEELGIPDTVEEVSDLLKKWDVRFLKDDDDRTGTISRCAKIEEDLFRFMSRLLFAYELVYNLDKDLMRSWKSRASQTSGAAEWKVEAYFVSQTSTKYRYRLGVMSALLEAIKKRQSGIQSVVGTGKLLALRGQYDKDEVDG